MSFFIDLDSRTFWTEKSVPTTDESLTEEEYKPTPMQTRLIFKKVKNSTREVFNGLVSFQIFPDGTKEFGLISIFDADKNEAYTLFINPYLSSIEIFKGEVDFNEHIPF